MTARANGTLAKRERWIYRTATGLVLAVMVFSIVNFVFNDHFPFPNGPEGAFVHLVIDPLIFLGLLAVSYVYFEKSHSPAAAAEAEAHR